MSHRTSERKFTVHTGREARAVYRKVAAEKALNDHDMPQQAFHDNRERLKAERVAREDINKMK